VIDSAGFMFVTSGVRVYKVAPDESATTVAGGGSDPNTEGVPPTAAELSLWMNDVELDGSGNLYLANRDRVLNLSGVAAGAARPGQSCDSPPDRPVWGTGWNGLGALGDASSPGRVRPDSDHPPITGVAAVAAGAFHSVALKGDGTVWAWGWNGYGQLGDGTTVSHATPTRVVGLSGVTAIAAGWVHNLAVTSDGSLWT